jgi:hypothetical protein
MSTQSGLPDTCPTCGTTDSDTCSDGWHIAPISTQEFYRRHPDLTGTDPEERFEECGLFAIYVEGHCVLPKGHKPAADHKSQYGIHFTRGLTKDEGGHE